MCIYKNIHSNKTFLAEAFLVFSQDFANFYSQYLNTFY